MRRIKNGVLWRLGLLKQDWNKTAVVRENNISFPEGVDVVHLFNGVYQGKRNWCTTFESQTPVTDDLLGRTWEHTAYADGTFPISNFSRKMLRLCAKENCLGLIALSGSAYRIQIEQLRKVKLPEGQRNAIMNKVVCIHPPQPVLITQEEFDQKFEDLSVVEFIIVGHDFFRKGGAEILDLLEHFHAQGHRFTLTIIGKLHSGDYSCILSKEEEEVYRKKSKLPPG